MSKRELTDEEKADAVKQKLRGETERQKAYRLMAAWLAEQADASAFKVLAGTPNETEALLSLIAAFK